MVMPNFLIIGAAKAGTTALYEYLRQHPQIYMSPVKETNFFALEGEKVDFRGPGDQEAINSFSITDLESYILQFQGVSNEIAIGEASPLYLYSSKAPERIKFYIPHAKLIAILRHPVERAYSSFLHLGRDGREPLIDFAQALREEKARIENNWEHIWHYQQMGFYYTQLKRYYDIFDRSQIKVYLYEDFKTRPFSILQDIFRFLGVDETFIPDMSIKANVSGIPKKKVMHDFLTKPNPIKTILKPFFPARLRQRIVTDLKNRNLVKPELSPEIRKQLIQMYREEILKLQDLIQRDLSKWLE